MRGQNKQAGSTLVELVIGTFLLGMIGLAFFGLFTALVGSALTAKLKSGASTLATNQMEYLKSLPYDELAVAGGSIYSTDPLPNSKTETLNNHQYTIRTSINYVDNAYDGCANYPTQTLKLKYCRNFPSPTGAPNPDTNPQDYKVVNVSVYSRLNAKLAEVDTQVAARVAETNSNTGSLFVSVIDNTGNPVQGANVQVTNSTLNPLIDLSDGTDTDGNALFYGLPPDTTGFDYTIRATKEGYSSLSTIKSSGTLQATYPSQNMFAQQASYVTLSISPQNTNSMAIESVDTNGNPLGSVNIYLKGGYKRYSNSGNTAYYYDNMSPDTRFTTNASGLASVKNLAPGDYYFCGDDGSTGCRVGISTYYLAAAVPYTGNSILSPILVPNDSPSPDPVFNYLSENYLQKTRLIFTTNANSPRITSSSISEASKSGGSINNFAFQLKGRNLPCSSSTASCSTVVVLRQGSSSFPASCTGNASGLVIDCKVNLSSATVGSTTFSITANGSTLNLPGQPLLGGINVIP